MVEIQRKTDEVEVYVKLEPDEDFVEVETGIGFLDHMLKTLAIHGNLGIVVKARGDLEVDEHHTIEDVAIALGKALKEVVKKRKIRRFGSAIVPMDDSVALCGIDVSGRGYFLVEGEFEDSGIKGENVIHFFDTICRNSGINAYMQVRGANSHHKIESAFKAFAISLRQALEDDDKVRSAKGTLDI